MGTKPRAQNELSIWGSLRDMVKKKNMKLEGSLRPCHGSPYLPGEGEGFCVVFFFSSQSINVSQIYNRY